MFFLVATASVAVKHKTPDIPGLCVYSLFAQYKTVFFRKGSMEPMLVVVYLF